MSAGAPSAERYVTAGSGVEPKDERPALPLRTRALALRKPPPKTDQRSAECPERRTLRDELTVT